MNADGSNQTNQTHHPSYDGTPTWSPDGTTIAFRSNRSGGDVWLMNADGSNQRALRGPGLDRTPAFSPDGTQILFVSNRGGNEDVWVMGTNGQNARNLTKAPGGDFDPDQRRRPSA